MSTPITISSRDAKRLLLGAQALLDDPSRPNGHTPTQVAKLIERMGFVQIDTINVIERAHHLILSSRIDTYDRNVIDALLGPKYGKLFEHWTHDASLIPTTWFAHWRHRFERYRASRWHDRQIGKNADRIVADVLQRVRKNGPMMSKDFEHIRENGAEKNVNAWWGWKPQKVALDYLWRIGELHVVGRRNFQKIYDITERVVPHFHSQPAPSEREHVDWACRTALERLGVASPSEISRFWNAISIQQVRGWVRDAASDGQVIEVLIESADGSPPKLSYAFSDVRNRIKRLPDAPHRARLLAPFDPVVRDRARAKRLFNFDFRFEAFVPAAQRVHGYYIMPILDGEEIVGRLDPKLHRDRGELEVRFFQTEPTIKLDRARKARVREAIDRLAAFVGAKSINLSGKRL